MMKQIVFIMSLVVIVATIAFISFQEDEQAPKEDLSSYEINDRYDCGQIQNTRNYNECVRHYLSKTPYKPGDKLVPIRLVG